MFIFKKLPDPGNQFDNSEIEYKCNEQSLPEILNDFKDFLAGCGYPISFSDSIELVKENEDEE